MSSSDHETYKLRATLTGHAGDVRTLCRAGVASAECIVSGSRDKTVLVWTLEGERFVAKMCLKGHEKYVSSVGWVPATHQYPQGLFLTGSHDKLVNVYNPLSTTPTLPIYCLSGHKDAVSSITAHPSGMVVTGSWDCTAKLWQDSFCIATFQGHELAVWAVEFVASSGDGDVLLATGSADKTVRLWNKLGQAGKILRGHSDVVRGLVSHRPNELLSCANDASIRQWDVTMGTCLLIYYGHTNYIYSINLLGGHSFVTSSEDASVRVWKIGTPDATQTIRLPARSIWAVTTLQNGDIAAGGSDSIIRIFTRDSSRLASVDALKALEAELASMEHSTKEVLEGVKTEDLPTDSALFAPGEKDGQTKIIRSHDGRVEVYNWSASESIWQKIGDVVGSSGGNEKSSGRTLHQGKEYDFVFSVDFDESKPPVKLPYNRSDDPWHVAQKFLEDNELPQSYLDTVAKFILQNVPDAGASAPVSVYADPFTGSGRYVPGGASPLNAAGSNSGATSYLDPFTGGSAYFSGGGSTDNHAKRPESLEESSVNTVYPVKEFIGFHLGNLDGVLKKLKENIESTGQELAEDDITQFRQIMQKDLATQTVTLSTVNALGKALDLSEDIIFPALDLLRFAMRHPIVCEYFCGAERSAFFLEFLLPLIKCNKFPTNQQLTLKVISNMFVGGLVGQKMLFTQRKAILTAIRESAASSLDKNLQIARSTVLLNYAVLITSHHNIEEKLELLFIIMEIMKTPETTTDAEALYRILVALGTLLTGPDSAEELKGYAKALDMMIIGTALVASTSDDRVKSVWRSLQRDFS